MSKWWAVENDSGSENYKQLLLGVNSDVEKDAVGLGATHIWLEVPEGVALGNAKVLDTEGVLSLIDGAADKAGPKWDNLRAARNLRLTACDWTQLEDSPLDAPGKAAWAAYRQDLRDLPEDTVDPEDITWPTEP
jgi:hypothetical protein